uniref:Uncharacterized protein n=1 Tax=Anguilla anguilla TaxID=7936 RepID=A0A0E9X6E1_ANGAN
MPLFTLINKQRHSFAVPCVVLTQGELVLWSQCLPRFSCCFCTVNQQEACSVPSGEIGGL